MSEKITAKHIRDHSLILLGKWLDIDSEAMVADEMLLTDWMAASGGVRADLAIIEANMAYGVEVKSTADNLTRLASQVVGYEAMFDRNVIAVASNHLSGAVAIVPETWGVVVCEQGDAMMWRAPGWSAPTLEAIMRRVWGDDLYWALATYRHGFYGQVLTGKEKCKTALRGYGKSYLIRRVQEVVPIGEHHHLRRVLLRRYQERRLGQVGPRRTANQYGPTSTMRVERARIWRPGMHFAESGLVLHTGSDRETVS